MNNPLDQLTKELETLRDGRGLKIDDIVKKSKNINYPRTALVRDLVEAKLGFFASKLQQGYYDMIKKVEKEEDAKTDN